MAGGQLGRDQAAGTDGGPLDRLPRSLAQVRLNAAVRATLNAE
jgi:hypothetical protein